MLGDGFAGVDLDHCRDPETGTIEPWAAEIVKLFGTYTKVSPSGTGVKLFGRGALPEGVTGRRKGHIEVYGATRYFTVTGHRLPERARGTGRLHRRSTRLMRPVGRRWTGFSRARR